MRAPFETDLARFIPVIRARRERLQLSDSALTLARQGRLSVQWIPFGHVPGSARLAIVGIAPGRQQAANALRAFAEAILGYLPIEMALRRARLCGAVSGPMRQNLIRMLNVVGLHDVLGAPNCAAIVNADHERVHFTTALRYPVFVNDASYNGSPDIMRTPLLRLMVERFLGDEVEALPDALWLPLGSTPTKALHHLVSIGVLTADRILEGMPHPSGANTERIKSFLGFDRMASDRGLLTAQVSHFARCYAN